MSRYQLTQQIKKQKKDISALKKSITKLTKNVDKLMQKQKVNNRPANKFKQIVGQGNPKAARWTNREETQLINNLVNKMPIDQVATVHNRTKCAIISRIIKMIRQYISYAFTHDDIATRLGIDKIFVNNVSTIFDDKRLIVLFDQHGANVNA